MVCNRCVMVVQSELEKLHFPVKEISLGEVILQTAVWKQIKQLLQNN